MKRPPIGVMPDDVWRVKRAEDLIRAMHRQLDAMTGDQEDYEASCDLIHQWAVEITRLNIIRAAPF